MTAPYIFWVDNVKWLVFVSGR